MNPKLASLADVSVQYRSKIESITALDSVSVEFEDASSTAIVGRSGSGKSTLVSVLTLLRRPTSGLVTIRGVNCHNLGDPELSVLRGATVGTVFQSFHLDATLSASDNVMLPYYFAPSGSYGRAKAKAKELLSLLGIADLARRRPGEMSGGQRQRVAIARALFSEPPMLVADEPTGNLDETTAREVSELLFELPEKTGAALVVVTHDQEIASRAERILTITHGRVSALENQPT